MPRSTLPVEITHANPMTNEATMSPLSSQLVVVLRHASLVSNARFISVHVSFCHADSEPCPSDTEKECALQALSHWNLRLGDLAVAPVSRPGTFAPTDGPSCCGADPIDPAWFPFVPRQGSGALDPCSCFSAFGSQGPKTVSAEQITAAAARRASASVTTIVTDEPHYPTDRRTGRLWPTAGSAAAVLHPGSCGPVHG